MFFNPQEKVQWEVQRSALYEAFNKDLGEPREQDLQNIVKNITQLQEQLFANHKKFYKKEGLSAQQGWAKVQQLSEHFLSAAVRPRESWLGSKKGSLMQLAMEDFVKTNNPQLLDAISKITDITTLCYDGMFSVEHLMKEVQKQQWGNVNQSTASCASATPLLKNLWDKIRSQYKRKDQKTLATRFLLSAVREKVHWAVSFWLNQESKVDQSVYCNWGAALWQYEQLEMKHLESAVWDLSEGALQKSQAQRGVQKSAYSIQWSGLGEGQSHTYIQKNTVMPLWLMALSLGEDLPMEKFIQGGGTVMESFFIVESIVRSDLGSRILESYCNALPQSSLYQENFKDTFIDIVHKKYPGLGLNEDKKSALLHVFHKAAARWERCALDDCLQAHQSMGSSPGDSTGQEHKESRSLRL